MSYQSLKESTLAAADQTKARMKQLLDATPDDKLDWRPAANARSIKMVVAHCTDANKNIINMFNGTRFGAGTSAEADPQFMVKDSLPQTREELVANWENSIKDFQDWINSASDADLEAMAPLPFGMGDAPVHACLTAPVDHASGHIAQIEYIQTLYGDRDWHMGF